MFVCLALGLIVPAWAENPDPGPEVALKRLDDLRRWRFLGGGHMADAFGSPDGKTVAKVILDVIADFEPIAPADRERISEDLADAVNALAKAGLPVPRMQTRQVDGRTVLLQPFVAGLPFDRLSAAAQRVARQGVAGYLAWANQLRKERRAYWRVSKRIDNFRFNERGEVVGWFDPVRPISQVRGWWIHGRRKALEVLGRVPRSTQRSEPALWRTPGRR
jgi:hypothetical protein